MSRRGLKWLTLIVVLVVVLAILVFFVGFEGGDEEPEVILVEDTFTGVVSNYTVEDESDYVAIVEDLEPGSTYSIRSEMGGSIDSTPLEEMGVDTVLETQGRTIVYSPGIDPALVDFVKSIELERLHVFLLFTHNLNELELIELRNLGVGLLGDRRDFGGRLSVPADLGSLEKIAAHPRVQWIGVIQPEDKIEEVYILRNNIPSWAVNEDGTLKVKIRLYGDASYEDVKEELVKKDVYIEAEYPEENVFYTHLYQNDIREIAEEDGITWIILFGAPDIPELDQSRPLIEADTVQENEGVVP